MLPMSHMNYARLNISDWLIETLRETDDIDHASQAHFLAIMDEEFKRMTKLIDDLISSSRVEVEEHILPAEQVHLDEVITNVVAILSGRAQKREMTISFDNHIADNASQARSKVRETRLSRSFTI